MLNTVPHAVEVTVLKSLALRNSSLNPRKVGLLDGLNAGSFTVRTLLVESKAKNDLRSKVESRRVKTLGAK